ncbi:hypothetical protein [Leuconostoc citreum]|uniref:hypothetical protein n=1 Tax=Leuconostoc citreum TaxID=33964 RepID=UPI0025A0B612|nr:hypothetical protein [Leuconostoc citreum]MDM7641080.1 hypothetical protein [Leuconostoc citreum]
MTFDEMIEKLLNNEDYNTDGLSVDDVITLIEVLRLEYAPTVKMTKAQNEAFVESVEGIATQEQLDSFIDEELDLGDMTVRKGLNAWLHPETIKIVDE